MRGGARARGFFLLLALAMSAVGAACAVPKSGNDQGPQPDAGIDGAVTPGGGDAGADATEATPDGGAATDDGAAADAGDQTDP